MSSFGERLRQLRGERQLSLETLARRMSTTKQAISRYERGGRIPNLTIGRRYADHFGVSLDYLMGATDDPTPPAGDALPPEIPRHLNIVPVLKKRVPLLGEIAAGVPIYAEHQYDASVTADDDLKCDFALRVVGDSMIGARIESGDIVFIRAQPDVRDGQIAAVSVDDEATLKRVYHTKGGVTLVAENPDYPPFTYREKDAVNVRILGLAVALHHRL